MKKLFGVIALILMAVSGLVLTGCENKESSLANLKANQQIEDSMLEVVDGVGLAVSMVGYSTTISSWGEAYYGYYTYDYYCTFSLSMNVVVKNESDSDWLLDKGAFKIIGSNVTFVDGLFPNSDIFISTSQEKMLIESHSVKSFAFNIAINGSLEFDGSQCSTSNLKNATLTNPEMLKTLETCKYSFYFADVCAYEASNLEFLGV